MKTQITKDELFLLDDIVDTLMERYSNIGTNILEAFPRTYRVKNKIYLADRSGKTQYVLKFFRPRLKEFTL